MAASRPRTSLSCFPRNFSHSSSRLHTSTTTFLFQVAAVATKAGVEAAAEATMVVAVGEAVAGASTEEPVAGEEVEEAAMAVGR